MINNSKKKSKTVKVYRKHGGIIQNGENRGKLKKGYKYAGGKTKTGLSRIVKTKNVNNSRGGYFGPHKQLSDYSKIKHKEYYGKQKGSMIDAIYDSFTDKKLYDETNKKLYFEYLDDKKYDFVSENVRNKWYW